MFDTLQPACYGIVSIFFALSTITILLRLYSRGFVIKSVGWDDWCMLAILFFNCGHQAILYYFIHYGGGLHIEDVMRIQPEWITHLTYALFAEELYYAWMHFVIKMAFLLFYLRFATKTFRTLVYCTIAVNVIFTVLQWLLYCFQCIPLEAFFDRAAHPTVKCLDNKLLAFLPAACSIFTDACIVVLPIQPLWTIQVSLRKRIMLIGLVSLGGIVVLISCLRLSVLLEFQKMTDFTYSLGKIIIISSIELEVAIMAANAPALKIFFSQALNKRPGTRDGATNKSHNLSDMSRGHLKHNPTFSGLSFHASGNYSRHITTRNDKDDSSESLTKDKTSILVTSSIGVESHEISSSSPEFGISSHYEAV